MAKEEKDLEKTDVLSDEENDVASEADEDADVTRKINLDDLYDGAVNNTVVIDPITKDEILLSPKKPNYTIIGVVLAIVILLVLYYVNNKSDLTRTNHDLVPKQTTTSKTTEASNKGVITCKYSSKSDTETQEATYTLNYENDVIKTSDFEYNVAVISDDASVVEKDLVSQYETLYTNNSSLIGFTTSFAKNAKGFTFTGKIDYEKINFDGLVIEDDKTVLFIKPRANDTVSYVNTIYSKKGYTCTTASEE